MREFKITTYKFSELDSEVKSKLIYQESKKVYSEVYDRYLYFEYCFKVFVHLKDSDIMCSIPDEIKISNGSIIDTRDSGSAKKIIDDIIDRHFKGSVDDFKKYSMEDNKQRLPFKHVCSYMEKEDYEKYSYKLLLSSAFSLVSRDFYKEAKETSINILDVKGDVFLENGFDISKIIDNQNMIELEKIELENREKIKKPTKKYDILSLPEEVDKEVEKYKPDSLSDVHQYGNEKDLLGFLLRRIDILDEKYYRNIVYSFSITENDIMIKNIIIYPTAEADEIFVGLEYPKDGKYKFSAKVPNWKYVSDMIFEFIEKDLNGDNK